MNIPAGCILVKVVGDSTHRGERGLLVKRDSVTWPDKTRSYRVNLINCPHVCRFGYIEVRNLRRVRKKD